VRLLVDYSSLLYRAYHSLPDALDIRLKPSAMRRAVTALFTSRSLSIG